MPLEVWALGTLLSTPQALLTVAIQRGRSLAPVFFLLLGLVLLTVETFSPRGTRPGGAEESSSRPGSEPSSFLGPWARLLLSGTGASEEGSACCHVLTAVVLSNIH